jgi:hypothetical protein
MNSNLSKVLDSILEEEVTSIQERKKQPLEDTIIYTDFSKFTKSKKKPVQKKKSKSPSQGTIFPSVKKGREVSLVPKTMKLTPIAKTIVGLACITSLTFLNYRLSSTEIKEGSYGGDLGYSIHENYHNMNFFKKPFTKIPTGEVSIKFENYKFSCDVSTQEPTAQVDMDSFQYSVYVHSSGDDGYRRKVKGLCNKIIDENSLLFKL